jgi:hypothetical protein
MISPLVITLLIQGTSMIDARAAPNSLSIHDIKHRRRASGKRCAALRDMAGNWRAICAFAMITESTVEGGECPDPTIT